MRSQVSGIISLLISYTACQLHLNMVIKVERERERISIVLTTSGRMEMYDLNWFRSEINLHH